MKCLNAVEIAGVDDKKREFVSVPEWGEDCGVYVRELSVGEHTDLLKRIENKDTVEDERELWVATCAVDADGRAVFNPTDTEQLKMLADRSWAAMDRVVQAALDINGLSVSAQAEIEGNSNSPKGD